MKILVIGDTHGKLDKVRDIYPKLTDIDIIAHTGDHMRDGTALEKELGVPVFCVKGNCDGGSDRDFKIIETEFGSILLIHGHMQNVKYHLNSLMYKTMEENCKAVFFGHTHQSMVYETGGIHFVNPGSLTLPRDGSSGSYAIVRTSEKDFNASIVFYSTVMDSQKEKIKSGYIRNILNYSDRF